MLNVSLSASLLSDLTDQDVAVVGGGKTGAAAARLLLLKGARVRLFDDAALDKVRDGLKKNGLDVDAAGLTITAGGLDGAAIAACAAVVLSPGVPRAHAALQPAVAKGLVVNELELAVAVLDPSGTGRGLRVWAITGTNGKSTTTTMAGAIARQRDPQAFVGGNLGTPLCAAVVDGLGAGSDDAPRHLVIELSSYQLESLRFLPVHAAAITNLSPDHLDRYADAAADEGGASSPTQRYYAAKARVFSLMGAGGGVSLNAADPESQRTLFPLVQGLFTPCHFDVSQAVPGIEVRADRLVARRAGEADVELTLQNPHIIGHHNRQNAAAAAALALLSGFTKPDIQAGLDAYAGIAHRLERVGEKRGVVWWNDSKATNVDAAVTALKSFALVSDASDASDGGKGGVHLIAGGLGKGSPYAPLVDAARGKVVAVYTIGQDAPAVAAAFAELHKEGLVDVVDCGDLETATSKAAAAAQPGEHIVLSPACASFDQFRDYGHRGERLRALFAASATQGQP